jgi:hypothetical protein
MLTVQGNQCTNANLVADQYHRVPVTEIHGLIERAIKSITHEQQLHTYILAMVLV